MGESVVRALDGVSVSIEAGELAAMLGTSGSGKSTLLNLLAGMDRPTGGRLLFRGRNLAEFTSSDLALHRRRNVGIVFQSFNLIGRKSALENVMLPMIFDERSVTERRQRAGELLAQVGLAGRAAHRPSELSGGEQQRVAIARALANNPDLVLADEPIGNLDSKTAAEILELLRRLHDEFGRTLLLVTHDDRVASIAHRRIYLSDGKVVSGEPGARSQESGEKTSPGSFSPGS